MRKDCEMSMDEPTDMEIITTAVQRIKVKAVQRERERKYECLEACLVQTQMRESGEPLAHLKVVEALQGLLRVEKEIDERNGIPQE